MNKPNFEEYEKYFSYRNVSPNFYADYILPAYLKHVLPDDRDTAILDIGCGFGQILKALQIEGYRNLCGIDVSAEATEFCSEQGLDVTKIDSVAGFCRNAVKKYDFIIMSHVIEHLQKHEVIETLRSIKTHLLNEGGYFLIMTPNAQSNTGCYWAYEDFTHTTIFTAGSLFFVLKCAGFNQVEFIDPLGIVGSRPIVKLLKRVLILFYSVRLTFWNWVISSSFHRPSPQIYTFELKALAS